MIGILPEMYHDELLYSYLSRYAVMSGYSTFRGVAEDLYVCPLIAPNILLLNHMTVDLLKKLSSQSSMHDTIMNHTMFKWFVRFANSERREKAYKSAVGMKIKDLYNSLPISHNNLRFSGERVLQYCPKCVEIDRERLGETYFRTYHQIPELNICPVHKCYLHSTGISLAGNVTPAFKPAEMVIPIDSKLVYCENEYEKTLSEYLFELAQSPFDIENKAEVNDYLNYRLQPTVYMKRNGMRNMAKLTEDFNSHFSEIGIKREWWELQKIFTGYCYNSYEIALIGLFLEIPTKELCKCSAFDKLTVF